MWMDLEGIMLSEISQILYNFIYMWNLKNRTNEQTPQNRNRVIDAENKPVVAREERSRGRKEIGEGD